ncbi:hypothetical protein [Eubacterium ventriosum]
MNITQARKLINFYFSSKNFIFFALN